MSSDQNHSSDRMSALRARLDKFESVDEFIAGYSQYFFRGGILLPTRHAKPEGTQISMQIEIAGGETVLRAEGEVKQVRRNDLGRPVGMVIRFSRLDARSRDIVERVLQHKKTIAETGSMQAVVERATERRANSGDVPALGERDLNAIAAAIDDTFDSIFAGAVEPAVTVDTPIVPEEHGVSPARREAGDLHDPPTGQLEVHQTHDRGPALFDDDEVASLRAELAGDDDDDALEALKEIAASLEDDVDASEPATQQVPRAVAPGAAPIPSRTVFGMPAFEADDDGPAPPVEDPAPFDDDGELTDQHDVIADFDASDDDDGGDPDDLADAAAAFLSRISEDSGPAPSLGGDEDGDEDSDGDELASGRTASSVYRGVADDEGDDEGDVPPPVDDDHDDLKAAITGAYDAIDQAPHSEPVLSSSDQPIAPAPKGLLARFIAWLKRLFGG